MELQHQINDKINWAKNNPSICFHPWDTIEIRANGKNLDITCCCNLDQTNIIKSLEKDPFTDIKEKMLSGKLPEACQACKLDEDNNKLSERIKSILSKSNKELEEFKNSKKTEYIELRISFSSICSLACRSCEPNSSSTFAKIIKDRSGAPFEKDIGDNELYFSQILNFIKTQLDDTSKNVNFSLHVLGGEPLLSKGFKKLIDWAVETNYARHIILRITTSFAATIDNHLMQQIDRFAEVIFIASIDSVNSNYTYVRWPAKFNKIENNIQQLQDFKIISSSSSKWSFSLQPVFSLNNIFYIEEYLDYWNKWLIENQNRGFEDIYIIPFPLLHRTKFLDMQALPKKYRVHLKNILTKCLDHELFKNLQNRSIVLYTLIKKELEQLDKWADNITLWKLYLQYTAQFDVRTNTNFNILNKNLYNLLDQEDIDLYNSYISTVNSNIRLNLQTYDSPKI